MALWVLKEDNRFRVEWQGHSTDWLPDTPSNRKAILVFLRLLKDERDKYVFSFQELSTIVGSENRQASSGHVERFRECGCDMLSFLTRKRKVDSEVVEAVSQELLHEPLAKTRELQQRVNARLGRDDLSSANMKAALEQIPCEQMRGAVGKQIASGKAHYKEKYLLEAMMKSSSGEAIAVGEKAGIQIPESEGMSVSDPTRIKKLITPDVPVSSIHNPLRWVILCMVLYYEGVRLSVLGRWMKVHKTTILRWILGLALALWPMVYEWIVEKVKAKAVYVDEKWLKIRGKWHYWFVVLDVATQLPVLALLLPSRSKHACRWIGVKLKCIGKIPRAIITDGLLSYHYIIDIMEGAKHILCHFHHQQGVTRWLREKFSDKEQIALRKSKMKKVLQTNDKRTVRRRLQKLKESELDISQWVEQTESNLPKLLPSVGSAVIPRTINAIERFFRAFSRFYKLRYGFFSVISAKRELILFLLMYLFIQQPESGKAPIESIMPDARRMPLYKMINDPLGTVMGVENVKKNVKMADFLLQQRIAA
jgi:transposase-like protein